MKLKDIIGLISALVLAVAVAFLARFFLTRTEVVKKQPGDVVQQQKLEATKILVAGKTLKEGDTIKAGDLVWLDWPKKAVRPNYLIEGAVKPEDYLGAVVRDGISLDQPISLTDLAKTGDKGTLAAIITPGMKAVSIDVTPQSVSSGLIVPGDIVDVILSKALAEAGGATAVVSKTIAKNIKVLAIDFEVSSTREKPKTPPKVATLEVTAKQAEIITAAAKDGTLSLSLHSLSTKEIAPEPGSGAEPGGVVKDKTDKNVILMRGKERTEIQVRE